MRIFTRKSKVKVLFHQDVIRAMDREIQQYPDVEVGGKFVGYVEPQANGGTVLRVMQYLDAGPKATRTPTYHLPDGEYQYRLFRGLEALDQAVEHLGTWHSHHPNGLRELSGGDIEGYLADVNSPSYNLNLFLATLAVDYEQGFQTARHYLFVRGQPDFQHLSPDQIEVIDGPNPLTQAMEQVKKRLTAPPLPAWTRTPAGRQTLAGHKARFQPFRFKLFLTQRGELQWKGNLSGLKTRLIYNDQGELSLMQIHSPAGWAARLPIEPNAAIAAIYEMDMAVRWMWEMLEIEKRNLV